MLAQKPIVDTSIFEKWPYVSNIKISQDGKYLAYAIVKEPHGYNQVLESSNSNWRRAFRNCSNVYICSDCRRAAIRTADDSLYLIRLGTNQINYIGKADFFQLLNDNQGHEWLAYLQPGEQKKLVIRQMGRGDEQSEKSVKSFLFNATKSMLLVEIDQKHKTGMEYALQLWNLLTGEKKIIWEGTQASNCIFGPEGDQVVFIAKRQSKYSLWYYRKGMDQAEERVNDSTAGVDNDLMVHNESPVFSKDGKRVFFELIEKSIEPAPLGGVSVDVWSYRDIHLQEDQLLNGLSPKTYIAVLNIGKNTIRRMQLENEQFSLGCDIKDCKNYALLTHGGGPDFWWQEAARSSVYIESVEDGNRTLLKRNVPYAHDWFRTLAFTLSPNERYVVYYDPAEKSYFSYEIATKTTRNITAGLATLWVEPQVSNKWAEPTFASPAGIAGWLENDQALLIYDEFDVWQIDPAGIKKPINITNEYGHRNHIRFRLAGDPQAFNNISPDAELLFNAFATTNKYSGFYLYSPKKMKNTDRLTLGPYNYGITVKAKNSNTWVVRRESAIDAPNYFITHDFKAFLPLSAVHPQNSYNWLTSELVTWTLPDGSTSQGILYKPENFDPSKKYPLLLHYYEERSQEMYQFKEPAMISDGINIPYFVSRGYLVFIPDIHFKIGAVGESLLSTVVSGARYLSQASWVDSTKIGIQGHSFGGWETNYLITHTDLFAAAAEGAGSTDAISSYGGLFGGQSRHYIAEEFQGRARHNLWERQDIYIDGSPLLKADQVTTPLLMMHNKRDISVPWTQAIEFFTALRRLGKRVWMLQYDNGEHFVTNEDARDYTIRMTQFFDHYLKGRPPAKWMTEGILAREKGFKFGYELENDNSKVP